MSEYYWTERRGDTVIVHTQYVKNVAKFTDGNNAIQRGGDWESAEAAAKAYCAALEAKGYVLKEAK